MRPSGLGLLGTFCASVAFTALVAGGALGLVWLVVGPGIAAAAEIVISHAGGFGTGAPVTPVAPVPSGSQGPAVAYATVTSPHA
jgi:hypothetical protein